MHVAEMSIPFSRVLLVRLLSEIMCLALGARQDPQKDLESQRESETFCFFYQKHGWSEEVGILCAGSFDELYWRSFILLDLRRCESSVWLWRAGSPCEGNTADVIIAPPEHKSAL